MQGDVVWGVCEDGGVEGCVWVKGGIVDAVDAAGKRRDLYCFAVSWRVEERKSALMSKLDREKERICGVVVLTIYQLLCAVSTAQYSIHYTLNPSLHPSLHTSNHPSPRQSLPIYPSAED
jgi:hypothetical protein